MRLKSFIILALLISTSIIISVNSANAVECISIKLAKTSYLPQESVQVEIDANLVNELTNSDIFLFRNDAKIPTDIFISKISETKYFAWFDLPLKEGNYIVKVRGNCASGFYVASSEFKVIPTVSLKYDELKEIVRNKFSSLSLEEHLLSAAALQQDNEITEQALNAFVSRVDSCLNKNCSTKLNALTLIAFKDSLLRQKMFDAIEACQNYVNNENGEWKLYLNSNSTKSCTLWINNENSTITLNQGNNLLNLDFRNVTTETINVKVSCGSNIDGKLIYNYKKFNKEIVLAQQDNDLVVTLNNQGCFVSDFNKVFNGSCDKEASSYALLALAKTAKFNSTSNAHVAALSWLNRNAVLVEEKAVVYYITRDLDMLSFILGSQTSKGWWSKNISYIPDMETSAIATMALKSSSSALNETPYEIKEAIANSEKWILDKFHEMSLSEKSAALAFAFSPNDIKPILAFWPGIVKISSSESFNLILQNKGTQDIELNINLLNSTAHIEITPGASKNVQFDIPLLTTIDGRVLFETLSLDYHTKISNEIFSYSIPILIFTQKSSQEQVNGSVNASEEEINEFKQEEIKNETNELENKTVEINQSLLNLFRFIEKSISKESEINKPLTITIRLANKLNKDIKDISITYSSSLILIGESIRIEPNIINILASDESKTITIYLLPTSTGNYSGKIIAEGTYEGQDIETSIPININVKAITVEEEKNCSEMGGKVCSGTDEYCEVNMTVSKESFFCCVPAEKCKKKSVQGTTIALIIIVVIIVALLIILYLIKKKPKKEMQEFLEKTSKAYEKRFQRPTEIIRV